MTRRFFMVTVLLLGFLLGARPAGAFVPFRGDDGLQVKWFLAAEHAEHGSLTYYINRNGTADPVGGPDVFITLQKSFERWLPPEVPTTIANVVYGGTTPIDTYGFLSGGTTGDGKNVLLFVSNDPDLGDGTLALTLTIYDTSNGRIVETDIAFNEDYQWRTDGTGDGRYTFELANVAIHEIGHFLGLDHSFVAYVGELFDAEIACTMWPYEFGLEEQSLEDDDIAGITTLYPNPTAQNAAFGSISGQVTKASNSPLFGIHVVTISKADKVPRVAYFTGPAGTYQMDGVPPGDYYLYIESPVIDGIFFPGFVSSYWGAADPINSVWLYPHVEVMNYASLVNGNSIFTQAEVVTVRAGAIRSNVNFVVGSQASLKDMLSYEFDSESRSCGRLALGDSPAWPGLALWLLPLAGVICLRLRRRS